MISLIDQEIVTAEDTIAVDLLHNFLISRKYSLGAVHILRQQMSAFGWPPLPPLSAFVSNWLTPPPPFVSFRQLLGSAPFVQQTLPKTFWNDNMGDIHLLGSNLHVIWLCPMFKVKFTSILLWIHNFRTPKLPLLKIFLTPPPLVSNCQHLVYPPSPPCQLLSAIGLPPLPPSSAFVSICQPHPHPSHGWRNMWTAPNG